MLLLQNNTACSPCLPRCQRIAKQRNSLIIISYLLCSVDVGFFLGSWHLAEALGRTCERSVTERSWKPSGEGRKSGGAERGAGVTENYGAGAERRAGDRGAGTVLVLYCLLYSVHHPSQYSYFVTFLEPPPLCWRHTTFLLSIHRFLTSASLSFSILSNRYLLGWLLIF